MAKPKKTTKKEKAARPKRNFKGVRKGKATDGMEKLKAWSKGMKAIQKQHKGNQWWAMRSKHGRDKIFATPEIMWEAACEYFQAVDNNPLEEIKPIVTSVGFNGGSEIIDHVIEHKRPYTIQALCLFLGVNSFYFRNFKSQNKDAGFSSVIHDIEEVIYNQKFEGASAGFFNANIISRDLGLIDKTENTQIDKKSVADVFPDSLKD